MQKTLNKFTLQGIDGYDYEKDRKEINKLHSDMNHIVSEVKKKQWQKEKEEKERKEKEEKERKEKEEKEKKEKE